MRVKDLPLKAKVWNKHKKHKKYCGLVHLYYSFQ